jgi:nitroimidazol reductase NimA-like FMN-containing flavoprotein (pyridoxamine 5'-phosphate oxidase superfamily)
MPTHRSKPRQPRADRPHMPGYGIPTDKKGLLPWSWAEQRLRRSHNYWVSTVSPDGAPHTMVVWGLWTDGAFYFSTGKQTRKARNLSANPKCVLCTEHAHEAVIVQGEARLFRDPAKISFFTHYEKKYHWDMSAMQSEPVFEVKPKVVFGLYEKKFIEKATRWTFAG